MKTLKILAVAIVLFAGAAGAQTMGTSAGHDLDALWARAQSTYDLAQEDAVVLLESRTVTVGDEGTLVTRVHRVVWINTGLAIRAYADLRVPWNSATSTFDVELLRTWRDGRWWPDPSRISDTAVVETLPHALDHADDYTTMRETMLLHDGVELPCIMETAYTIAEQGSPTAGADDLFVLPQRDPAVRTEYVLRVPLGTDVRHERFHGAPEPVVTENGVREFVWGADDTPALAQPVTAQPAAYEPAILWTTWASWDALLQDVHDAVAAAAELDAALADSVAAVSAGLPEGLDRTLAVVDWLNASVRPIRYDARFWRLAPRAAVRTWESGYGHALDRAVLATALLGAVAGGLPTEPLVLVRPGFGELAPDLPRLADVTGVRVPIQLHGGVVDYDPETGNLVGASIDQGTVRRPARTWPHADPTLRIEVTLEPNGDAWEGTGFFMASGACADWTELQTGDGLWSAFVEGTLSSVLAGAQVTWARPALTGGAVVSARFGFTLDELEEAAGRQRLVIGQPATGIVAQLPADVQMADASRGSPVRMPAGGNAQSVTVRLKTAGHEVVARPEARAIDNAAGRFIVTAEQSDGWLTVTRSLALIPSATRIAEGAPRVVVHAPAAWPELRTLLLEETDPVNGTIVLEAED